MTTSEPVRIGVIGCGGIAQGAHLPVIHESSIETLEAVCDVRPRLARAVGERYGARKVYYRSEDLLNDPDIEAVVVALMHDLHPQVSIEALRCGKHVLVEKPMAMTVADARAMVTAAKETQRQLMVGYMWRYDAGTEAALQMVRGREIGEVNFALCGGEEGWHGWEDGFLTYMIRSDEPVPEATLRRPEWCDDPFVAFAHEWLLDSGSHTIDLLRTFLGEPVEVCFTDLCRMPRSQEQKAAPPFRILTVLRFPTAVVYYNLAYLMHDVTGMHLEMRSDLGSLEITWNPTLQRHRPARILRHDFASGIKDDIKLPPSWCFAREHEAFARAVRDLSYTPPTAARLTLSVNRICDAIIISWLQKTPVDLSQEGTR